MSASRERKKRMDQETVSKKKKMKFSEGWILAICVILILAVALCSVLVYRAVQRNQTVLTVGDHKVKIPEFNFFYFNNVSQVSGYATYFGMDTTQPLDQQYVTADGVSMMSMFGFDTSYLPELAEGADTYDMTWAQFFAAMTKDTVVQVYTIYDAAMDAGYTLEEEYRTEMEAEIAEVEAAAEANGESQNGLISRVYGNGCTMEGYRDYMEVTHIASHYPATITYGAEELSARYEESPEDFDAASFYAYSVAPSAFAETLEDGTKAEATDENAEQAKEAAEAMESKFDVDFSGEYGSVTLYADYTRSSVTTLCGEDAANWLFDTAGSEDVKLFQNGETYYVLKLMNKEDYRTVNAIEIFIADDAEELAEGEQTAEEKLTDIRTTLEADASEDSYRELLALALRGRSV